MYKQLAVALLALTMMVPVGIADHDDGVFDCDDAPPADPTLVDQAGFYVTDAGEVFEESNDEDGLQSEAVPCDSDDDGVLDDEIPADFQHL